MNLAKDPDEVTNRVKSHSTLVKGTASPKKKEEHWVVKDGRMMFLEPGKTVSQFLKEANEAARIAEAQKSQRSKDIWKAKLERMRKDSIIPVVTAKIRLPEEELMPRVSPVPNELEVLLEETTYTKKVLEDQNVKEVLGIADCSPKHAAKVLAVLGQPTKPGPNFLILNKRNLSKNNSLKSTLHPHRGNHAGSFKNLTTSPLALHPTD